MKLFPRIVGQLLIFGTLWQKPMIDWSDSEIWKNISVAHKDNGKDFFHEVLPLPFLEFVWCHLSLHFFVRCVYFFTCHTSFSHIDRRFSTFLVPDMTIEKLQKVASTHMDATFKARQLRWWNSPADVKTQNMFPSTLPLREKVLDEWLHKASFWARVLQAMLVECMCGSPFFQFKYRNMDPYSKFCHGV